MRRGEGAWGSVLRRTASSVGMHVSCGVASSWTFVAETFLDRKQGNALSYLRFLCFSSLENSSYVTAVCDGGRAGGDGGHPRLVRYSTCIAAEGPLFGGLYCERDKTSEIYQN